MAIPTVNVLVHVEDAAGNAVSGAKVNAKLNRSEVDAGIGYVIPEVTTVTTDVNGDATLVIWPNALGATESSYEITISEVGSRDVTSFTATIPNSDCNLWDVANLPVYPGKSDGELAADAAANSKSYAEEWANKAEDSLISADAGGDQIDDYSAMHWGQKTSADAVATAADRVQTGLDVVATNADVVATNADVVTTNNNVTAAQAAQTAAELAYDSFDDRYLGTKASDPTLDNDGNALVTGALYFHTSVPAGMKVYDGAAWDFVATVGIVSTADATAITIDAAEHVTFTNGISLGVDLPITEGGTGASTALNARTNLDVYSTTEVDTEIATGLATKVSKTSDTGSAELPVGTTAQRDSVPVAGYVRYNSTTGKYEGYFPDLTLWAELGGGQLYGNAAVKGVFYNNQTIAEDVTIEATNNAQSAGPITIDTGFTVTVETGARWVIN